MPHSSTSHSHPICPTCESDLTGRDELPRFCAASGPQLLTNDNAAWLHEETAVLVRFLAAVAQAMPLATAQYKEIMAGSEPDWLEDLRDLAAELSAEAQRRLALACKAGRTCHVM
jgi:predicted amidophosphoribosyltransferase